MQFAFFYLKNIQKVFWKTIDFVENLEIAQIAGGGGGGAGGHLLCVLMTQWVRKSICDSPLSHVAAFFETRVLKEVRI